MEHMQKSAHLVLTGYDLSKIEGTVSKIKKYTKEIGLEVKDESISVKGKSELWGCQKDDTKQKSILVSGSLEDLQKLIKIKTADGVYVQLLLK
jgi:ribosomal protein S10